MKRKWPRLIILFSCAMAWLNSSPVHTAPEKYSLEDLEILAKQKSYWEFLQHARDIRPGQRNKHWRELVQEMATQFIEFNLRSQSFGPDNYTLLRQIARWPVLRDDEFFQVKYNNYMLRYLNHCFKNDKLEDCITKIEQFWHLSNKDPETGYQFVQLIQKSSSQSSVWNLLKDIVTHPMSDFYCQRPLVATQLKQKILTDFGPFITPKKTKSVLNDSQIRKRLGNFMHEKCWQSLLSSLKQSLFSEIPRHQMILHKILSAKKALNSSENDLFYALYLLQGPLIGEAFNQSWNALVHIGQNFERKMALLKALQKRDPLEGKIFASFDHNLKKTVVRHFAKHFPEYLDLYAKTCLDYREGRKTFHHGNPTIECPEFFKISQGTAWISQKLHLRFSSTQSAQGKKFRPGSLKL